MVPDSRSSLRGLLRALRASRGLALALGVATGAAALVTATRYAHVSLYEHVLLPLGVGGFVYYVAHYDLGDWEQDATARGFLRNLAIGLLATSLVADAQPFADAVVSFVTVLGVVFLAILTAVVDVLDAPRDDDDDVGDGDRGTVDEVASIPRRRRSAWRDGE
jgi:hypothetical protein